MREPSALAAGELLDRDDIVPMQYPRLAPLSLPTSWRESHEFPGGWGGLMKKVYRAVSFLYRGFGFAEKCQQ